MVSFTAAAWLGYETSKLEERLREIGARLQLEKVGVPRETARSLKRRV